MPDGISLVDTQSLSNDTLIDLLKTALPNLPMDGKFELLQKYNTYPVCNQWFKQDKATFDSGTSIVRNVQLTENGSAKLTRPYAPSSPAVVDVQARLRANWTQATADFSISRQETMRNRNTERIVDLLKTRRAAAYADLCNLLEEYAWAAPSSTGDDLTPLGIPYWLVPATIAQQTAGTGAHQGGNPSGFSDCGGIDASATKNARWRNYNDTWADASGDITDDEVTKITKMLRRLQWEVPVFVTDANQPQYSRTRLYSCETTLQALETRARAQNDNLGFDVGRYAGSTFVKNIPIAWAQLLDDATVQGDTVLGTNPFVAINHDYFQPFVMEGDFFRETGPMNDRNQHDVFTTFVDLQFNYICTNRQKAGGIISRKVTV